MKKFLTSLFERLVICYHVLTKKNYIYFGLPKDPIVWDESGDNKSKGLSFYESVDKDYLIEKDGKYTNLHNIVWSTIEDIAKMAQKGEF